MNIIPVIVFRTMFNDCVLTTEYIGVSYAYYKEGLDYCINIFNHQIMYEYKSYNNMKKLGFKKQEYYNTVIINHESYFKFDNGLLEHIGIDNIIDLDKFKKIINTNSCFKKKYYVGIDEVAVSNKSLTDKEKNKILFR